MFNTIRIFFSILDNKIGDNGAKYIGEGISKLTLLTYLYLGLAFQQIRFKLIKKIFKIFHVIRYKYFLHHL